MKGEATAKAILMMARKAAKIRYPAVDESRITRALIIWENGELVIRCQHRGSDGKWDTVQVVKQQLDQVSMSEEEINKL